MQMKKIKTVLSFDPGADRYLGIVFEDVSKTITSGTAPGFHDAIAVEYEERETAATLDI